MTTPATEQSRIPLCLGCGAVAPLDQQRCVECQHTFESPRPYAPPASDQTQWARVRTSFECRACGHRSPIGHLDVDGTVLCLSCGIEQRFEKEQWWDALDHAHAVADGIEAAFEEHQQFDEQHLELHAAPGWPLCSKCRSPLAVKARDKQGLTMHCPSCQKERSYALPPKLSQRAGRLVGIIADQHELGQKEATLVEENGVSALKCPTCGAGLNVSGASTIVTCSYCSNACRVHPRALPKGAHGTAAALPFWLLFEGPSRARLKRDKQRQQAAERARAQAEQAERQVQQHRAGERPPSPERARRGKRPAWVDWVAIAGAVGGSLAFGLLMNHFEQKREREGQEQARARAEEARRAREASAASAPERVSEKAGEPFAFSARLDAVKVEGQPVAVGEPCVIAVDGAGDKINHLLVQCQKAVLYDSTTELAGMRMLAFELYRSSPGAPPDGLRYSDTGQRSSGSEVSLDTRLNQAAAWSQVVPIFRVDFGPHQEKRSKPKPKRAAAPTSTPP